MFCDKKHNNNLHVRKFGELPLKDEMIIVTAS